MCGGEARILPKTIRNLVKLQYMDIIGEKEPGPTWIKE